MSVYLVDTHAVLWFLAGDLQLSDRARGAIQDPVNVPLVSAASIWEMAIKRGLGKLDVPDELLDVLEAEGFETLSVAPRHAMAVAKLPMTEHRDPFDRLLAAQALEEDVPVIGGDARLDQYGVDRLW